MKSNDSIDPLSSSETIKEEKNLGNKDQELTQVLFNFANKVFKQPAAGLKDIVGTLYKTFKESDLLGRYLPHFAIVFLLFIVVTSNYYELAKASELSRELVSIDPESEYSIVDDIGVYTLIENDADVVEKQNITISASDGFLNYGATMDTQITVREIPEILPDNTKDTIYYVVKNGDTLSGLGAKFGVKLATLKYLNDLDNINSIRPGMKMKVPPKGYEVSQAQIAKKEKEKQAKLAQSRTTVSRSSSTTQNRTYSGDYQGSSSEISLSVPVSYSYISRGVGGGHAGIDYVCSVGTPVRSSAAGVVMVVSTGWSGGYGNMIVVNHGGGIATRYGHLSQINVSPGETVTRGQKIGLSGNTGRSTGPHLHFEKLVNGRWVYVNLR